MVRGEQERIVMMDAHQLPQPLISDRHLTRHTPFSGQLVAHENQGTDQETSRHRHNPRTIHHTDVGRSQAPNTLRHQLLRSRHPKSGLVSHRPELSHSPELTPRHVTVGWSDAIEDREVQPLDPILDFHAMASVEKLSGRAPEVEVVSQRL
jgi:hypothetical protein